MALTLSEGFFQVNSGTCTRRISAIGSGRAAWLLPLLAGGGWEGVLLRASEARALPHPNPPLRAGRGPKANLAEIQRVQVPKSDASQLRPYGIESRHGRRIARPAKQKRRPRAPFSIIRFRIGRGGGIRTHDPLPPRQMRYQAALRPDDSRTRNSSSFGTCAGSVQRRSSESTSSSSIRT